MFDIWRYILGLDRECKKIIGNDSLNTLILLATYADDNGFCTLTTEEISEKLGITENEAAARINKLLKTSYQGELILLNSQRGYHINLRLQK